MNSENLHSLIKNDEELIGFLWEVSLLKTTAF